MSLGPDRKVWLLTTAVAAVLAAATVFVLWPWVRGGAAGALSAGLAVTASTGLQQRWSDGRWRVGRAAAAGAVVGGGAWLGHHLAHS